ncbi:glycosyl hydrolase [Fructilactobacillus florum 2F]|nr:glycosyl hydrolase [Fructilactobacillus florum 2F]
MTQMITPPLAKQPADWWKNEIIYEIYCRSFQDSNGDGIGDLQGIISRLDYLQELGVTALWIAPVYRSPMVDMGYDIAAYQQIDPVYGTMADMDELLEQAQARGIKIIMDMVLNHTSDQHPWFQAALQDPTSKYRDYYVFQHPANGQVPNNWRATFGGSTWEPVPNEPGTYYFHTFATEQPDLNWENPALRQELYRIINWWLDKGVAGFRLDAITQLKKDQDWASLPPDDDDGLVNVERKGLNRPGLGQFLAELKAATFSKYNAVTIGEAYGVPLEQLEEFVGPGGYFSMIFDFSYLNIDVQDANEWFKKNQWEVSDLAQTMFMSQQEIKKARGYFANVIENHDQNRAVSKFIRTEDHDNPAAAKALAALYFFLAGIPVIYQGQELGMTNFERSDLQEFNDLSSINNYQRALANGYRPNEALKIINFRSRDNARVPMPWDQTKFGGFSTVTPWLAPAANNVVRNVAQQRNDPASVWSFYQKLIRLRQDSHWEALWLEGEVVPVRTGEDEMIVYQRRLKQQTVQIMINLSGKVQPLRQVVVGQLELDSLATNGKPPAEIRDLQPYQVLIVTID